MNNFIKKSLLIICLFLLLTPVGKVRCEDDTRESSKEKIVYLTFDDGPGGDTTKKVLDVLQKEQVPATFFVIGDQIKGQEDIILRMKNEGHSIGLHSFTHDRNKLYPGCSGFINEMKKVQDSLYEVTGETYSILRFPFGCNNSTYRLTNEMVDCVHSNNMKIYDWTQDTLDGANPNSSPDTILNRAISNADTIVVLMHTAPANKNSAIALSGIIKYYKNKGYTFKKITEETPEIYKITKK